VSFKGNEILIGNAAKNLMIQNPTKTIYNVKRLIGRNFYDKTVQNDIKVLPFKVEKDENSDIPMISVEGIKDKFYPQQISAMILSHLKQTAEDYLGQEVEDVVITVPAYFNAYQKKATKEAGKIAGLNVMKIINEPTAAAVAYGLNNKDNNERYILVFDLGGGTFDVSILILNEEVFEVRATCGDTHLGGEDFDNRLVNYCAKKFKENTGIDISGNQKAKRRLKLECEKVKRNLSTAIEAHIEIENLANEESLSITVSRSDFENMCQDLFNKCIEPLKKSLSDAKITKDKISEVVLVGGSTRIPKICEIVENFFDGKSLNKNINADEAVAYGATYEAAVILDLEDEGLEKLVLLDVTPLSLGVEIEGERMSVIIPRNKPIPIKKTNNYVTTCDFQEEAQICVYQEKENSLLIM
jgi:L1 cell adhesion molecule like protein